jgi:hypothetical protein
MSASNKSKVVKDGPVWVKSKWSANELDGKTVEFRIKLKRKDGLLPAYGNGVFRALTNHEGLSRIEIVIRQWEITIMRETVFFCPQRSVDHIEKNELDSKFHFSLFDYPAP